MTKNGVVDGGLASILLGVKLSIDCKKTATGNGNLQPEIEINEYSSSKNYSSGLLLE